jgi:flap endonuclease-1
MVEKGDVWATASQDFDSLMYGAPRLIRNLSITGRRKLPRKNVYIKIEPEIIELSDFLSKLNITHSQLIDIGLLVGTDYNPKGVVGVGPKTALKLLKKHLTLQKALMNLENAEFPYPIDEIKELFVNPRTTNDYLLEWRRPDSKGIVDFLCGERDFNRERVNKSVEKLEKGFDKWRKRVSLDFWFD